MCLRCIINPATKLVIPAAAERRAGIQKRPCDYWIPAFAGMTGWWVSIGLFNCQVNITPLKSANRNLHPPVLGAAPGGVVAGNRIGFAVPVDNNLIRTDTVVIHQIDTHTARPAVG